MSQHEHQALEQVESILGGQPPAAVPVSACDIPADDLPEFLRTLDQPVVYGAHC